MFFPPLFFKEINGILTATSQKLFNRDFFKNLEMFKILCLTINLINKCYGQESSCSTYFYFGTDFNKGNQLRLNKLVLFLYLILLYDMYFL